jgi:lipoyl(octanoyl) transferase
VTTHGFAINVDNDLAPFGWVVACGLTGVQMTSVLAQTAGGPAASLAAVRARMAERFAEAFARTAVEVDLDRIGAAAPAA